MSLSSMLELSVFRAFSYHHLEAMSCLFLWTASEAFSNTVIGVEGSIMRSWK